MERPLAPPPLSDGVICSLLRHEPLDAVKQS
jgi:hypothetical protein